MSDRKEFEEVVKNNGFDAAPAEALSEEELKAVAGGYGVFGANESLTNYGSDKDDSVKPGYIRRLLAVK